jgi:hypothetical protein
MDIELEGISTRFDAGTEGSHRILGSEPRPAPMRDSQDSVSLDLGRIDEGSGRRAACRGQHRHDGRHEHYRAPRKP